MHLRFETSNLKLLVLTLVLLGWLAPMLSRAADVEVSASLSESRVEVGEAVQYNIVVSGATSADVPLRIEVDGLNIGYSGPSVQSSFNMINGRITQTQQVTYSFVVVPQRAGKFVIPEQTVEVRGKRFTTKAVALNVGTGGGNSGNAAAGGEDAGESRLHFAEVILPKQTAYVGEAIPIELRFYVDTRIHWQTEQPPKLGGEGITIQKFPKPQQNQVNRDGRTYDLVTFKTAITPAKAGKLTLGPATLDAIAQMPRRQQPRRPRDPFGDPFEEFFNNPFGALAPPQKLTVTSAPVELEVKPLPPAGQPKSFSGAVGQFKLELSASPTKVQVGEPITVKAKITGRGNFDRVSEPQVADESGWRSYPPSAKFQADDDVGISGAKTFDIAVIPNEKKDKLPAIQWSFFNPITEKYETLTGKQLPITVEGAQAAPSPALAGQPSPGTDAGAAASPVAQATPAPSDILYIRTDEGRWVKSFEPIYRSRGFWLAQIAPMAALLAFVGFRVRRERLSDLRAQQLLGWRREKSDALRTLRRADVSEVDALDAAVRCIQLDTAMTTGREPATVDAAEACASRQLDAQTTERIQSFFTARAELRYAGTARGTQAQMFAPERREEMLETIKRFEEAKPRV